MREREMQREEDGCCKKGRRCIAGLVWNGELGFVH